MNYLLKYKTLGVAGLLALVVLAYGCTDNFSSINTNPNQPSSAQTPFLLTNAQKDLADNYWGEFELGYFGALYSQYWSQNQYTSESRYSFRTSVVNDIWEDYYTSLNDLQEIIRLNREFPDEYSAYGNNANQIAVAKILKAWTYQTMTDVWGSIPFENALGGRSNPSPAYSTQREVYTGVIRLLTEASDSIDVNAPGFTSGDVFYNGNMAKWKKFANSLKMRAAMRISDVQDPEVQQMAETAFTEALAAGPMESNADNALFTYLSNVPNNNPIHNAYLDRDDFAVSKPLVDLLKAKNDPRLSAYASQTESDAVADYVGFVYGLAQGQAAAVPRSEFSRPSQEVRSADFPAIFMLYDEVEFLKAEAAELGWITGVPQTFYANAIEASMNYWGITDQNAINTYIANNPYSYPQEFGEQKWLAMYLQGIQGWAEWRRLDFSGVLVPPESGKLGVTFPTDIAIRYPYPTDEKNLNQENVSTAIENQGWAEDDQGRRVWWDVQ